MASVIAHFRLDLEISKRGGNPIQVVERSRKMLDTIMADYLEAEVSNMMEGKVH